MSKIRLLLLMPMCAAAVVDLSPIAGLQVRNLVPKFEAFYKNAAAAGVMPDQRWDMWVKEYGIAAVPPTPEGQTLARKQLDAVWNRYAALVPTLHAQEARAELSAKEILPKVESLLDPGGKPTPVKLILFVGQFDGNEFTAPPETPGGPAIVMMPIETRNIRFALAQEFVHAVQIDIDHLHNGFDAPLAETVLTVGLAMHATRTSLARSSCKFLYLARTGSGCQSAWPRQQPCSKESSHSFRRQGRTTRPVSPMEAVPPDSKAKRTAQDGCSSGTYLSMVILIRPLPRSRKRTWCDSWKQGLRTC